jgi:hypothetical protein
MPSMRLNIFSQAFLGFKFNSRVLGGSESHFAKMLPLKSRRENFLPLSTGFHYTLVGCVRVLSGRKPLGVRGR